MTQGEYTFRCVRQSREPEWTRVLAHDSDDAAIEEGRLLLQSQVALRANGPLVIQIGRGRAEGALEWLGSWRLERQPRWHPETLALPKL